MNHPPSPNGPNGRGAGGRFAKGNGGGPGNPHTKRVAELRSALLQRVQDEDVHEIVDMLIRQAKGGDIIAAREVLDRALGKSKQGLDINAQVETLEPEPEDSFAKRARMMRFYAEMGVPFERWIPIAQLQYGAWRDGCTQDVKPADFDEIVKAVEQNCIGWEQKRLAPPMR